MCVVGYSFGGLLWASLPVQGRSCAIPVVSILCWWEAFFFLFEGALSPARLKQKTPRLYLYIRSSATSLRTRAAPFLASERCSPLCWPSSSCLLWIRLGFSGTFCFAPSCSQPTCQCIALFVRLVCNQPVSALLCGLCHLVPNYFVGEMFCVTLSATNLLCTGWEWGCGERATCTRAASRDKLLCDHGGTRRCPGEHGSALELISWGLTSSRLLEASHAIKLATLSYIQGLPMRAGLHCHLGTVFRLKDRVCVCVHVCVYA